MRSAVILVLLSLSIAGARAQATASRAPVPGSEVRLTVLETTDLHYHVLGYDYYRLKPDPGVGLDRTATLIERARKQYPNTVLLDDGDTIQGTVLADYQARVKRVSCDHELGIYRAMDLLGYDGGTIGNHEFNYGLPYLAQVTGEPMNVQGVPARRCAGPHFPLVLSNVLSTRDEKPIYAPWKIIHKTVQAIAPDGHHFRTRLRIGLLGFTPPPIMQWDRQNLAGRVHVLGVVEAARRDLPQLKAQHPDLVVALLHGGLDDAPYTPDMENAGLYLARVPGIDAMLLGHMHTRFPGPRFKGLPGVDTKRGTVHGVPAVMGGFFGKDLGLIHLKLVYRDGHWHSDSAAARSEVRPICPAKGHCVPPDPRIRPLVEKLHKAAIAYVRTPIGHTDFRMSSIFADLGNVSALSVINAAQRDYVRHWIKENRPDLAQVPVLSAAAAFRNGHGGPGDYTDIPPGSLTLRNAASLYLYPNTLAAVRVDGAGLKAWLEHAAGRFHRIDPRQTAPQRLVNAAFPGFNFDQIQGGLHYTIDVSQPLGQRIHDLVYDGKPVQPDQTFIIATNNYRASGGGHFPGLDGHADVLDAPDANRRILIDWIRAHPHLDRDRLSGRSWHFAPLDAHGPIIVTGPANALPAARAAGLYDLRKLHDNADGTTAYTVDLGH
jgi:2',3'-cyclic-nucleotide 2'-phosphodiesterase/3'-nucleotidase